MQRILVMSHAHPDFGLGGGEIAAYNIFKAYKLDPSVEGAWFLARADRGRGAAGNINKRRDGEYLWEQGISDWHRMRAANLESVTTAFADLIKALQPTLVHTHHYAHLGLEYLRVIKRLNQNTKIFMTLHEYMAICRNSGQMIKTVDNRLCDRSSPDDCRNCYPGTSSEDFWLRKHWFMKHFELVDHFIAPSEFLRQRYIEWGLPEDKLTVFENGQSSYPPLPPRPILSGERRNRFGFFGQINPFKGLDLLLQALAMLPKEQRGKIVLEVHGANLEFQTSDFREKVEMLRKPLVEEGVVEWIGPYRPHELRARMANIDWVCVPSIWWENSPMVIQEAFTHGRPAIVSNIGGMLEKIKDNIDGLHVSVGSPSAWARTLLFLSESPDMFDRLYDSLRRPVSHAEAAAAHLSLIENLPSTQHL